MSCGANNKTVRLTVFEIVAFGLLGAMMFAGDVLMEWAPNVHFVGVLIVAATVVYRVALGVVLLAVLTSRRTRWDRS